MRFSSSGPQTPAKYSSALTLMPTTGVTSTASRATTLKERRLVSMSDMHLGALALARTAENWSASVTVRTAIDGRVVNGGAQLYRPFNNTHLEPLASEVFGEDSVYLLVRTCQSHLHGRTGGAHARVRPRTTARGSTPGHRRTGIHWAGFGT
jgi:hypothetical protein